MEICLNKDTQVVNMYKEPYDVYIGRSGKGQRSLWGNPYSAKEFGHEECINLYRRYIHDRLKNEIGLTEELMALKGKKLGCFCRPKSCHGDVLVEMMEVFCPDED